MDPGASPEGSSEKAEPKWKRARKTTKAVTNDVGTAHEVGKLIRNMVEDFGSARDYVRQKPVHGLMVAFGVGIVMGLLCSKW